MTHLLIRLGSKILLIGVFLGTVFSGFTGYSAMNSETTQVGFHIRSSSKERVVFSFHSPSSESLLAWVNAPTEKLPGLGDISFDTQAGAPLLPLYRGVIAIPPSADYDLQIMTDHALSLLGEFQISTALESGLVEDRDRLTGFEYKEILPLKENLSAVYPEQVIRIVDEAWIRTQRVLVVEFYPLQYTQSQKKLTYHDRIEAEILFSYTLDKSVSKEIMSPVTNLGTDLYDGALERSVLNYDTAREWQALPTVEPLIQNFPITDGTPGLKIIVDHAGIYQINYDDLIMAGMDLVNVDPAYLTLVNIESAVGYEFLGDDDHLFEAGEGIRFYGEPLPSERLETLYQDVMAPWIGLCPSVCNIRELIENYTVDNVYWLYAKDTTGLRIPSVDASPTDTFEIPEVFTDTQSAEQDLYWYPYHFTSSDSWFWQRSRTTITHTLPITLGVISEAGPNAIMRGQIYSVNNVAHHTTLSLNSNLVLDSYWSGKIRYHFQASFPLSFLSNGLNELDWGTKIVSAAEYQLFDRFEIEYSRAFEAVDDRLVIHYPYLGSWQYEIGGLRSTEAIIYDITDPLLPQKILGARVLENGGVYQVAFEMTQTAPASLIVAGNSAIERPKSMEWYEPPELEPPNGADYIFITHPNFQAATQVLADYRSSQGMQTLVVNVEDVYNQFNFGIYHPIAIRNYLERAMLTWSGALPSYILLIGDGTFEIRQTENLFVDEPNTMPPVLGIVDPWYGEIDMTSNLAAVIGSDIVPDLAIGRLPVKSAAEVAVITAKIIAYEQYPLADWQRKTLFIADNTDDAGNFIASSEELALKYTPPGFEARKIYQIVDEIVDCDYPSVCLPATTETVINDLDTEGALLVNFMGHGSYTYWAASTFFSREHVLTLNNGDHLPVILSWDCLDGFFYYPDVTSFTPPDLLNPSLAETWLLSEAKGAVATFSPAGLGIGTGHDIMASGFYDSIFVDGNWGLGPATLSAKLNLYRTGLFLDLIHTYTIFGDPALQISSPYRLQVLPETASSLGTPGSTVIYQITIQNTSLVEDSYDLSISGNLWSTSLPLTLGPVAAGASVVLQIQVLIPSGAVRGEGDDLLIEISSQGDTSVVDTVNIRTAVASASLFLPAIYK